MTTTCPTCKEPIQVAPSKRVQVCKNCLSIARTGKSLKEIAREKNREWSERSRLKSKAKRDLKPKKTYTIKNRSEKGAKLEREIAKTKTDMKRAALDGGFCECQGCGNFFDVIDASHKVQLSKTLELASEAANIRLLCRKCHNAWGEGTVAEMIELRCFCEDMAYLLDNDPERFWKIHFRLVDEYLVRPTPKLGMVISKLESLE